MNRRDFIKRCSLAACAATVVPAAAAGIDPPRTFMYHGEYTAGVWNRALTENEMDFLFNHGVGVSYEDLQDHLTIKDDMEQVWFLEEPTGTVSPNPKRSQ